MRKTLLFFFIVCTNTIYAQVPLKIIHAQVCLSHNDTVGAIQFLTDTLTQKPNNILAEKMRGDIYFDKKNFKNALDDYKSAFSNGDSSALYKIVLCYAFQNDAKNTIEWLKKYLKSSSKLPENVIRTNPDFSFLSNQKEWNDLWKTNWFNDFEVKLGDIYYLYEQKDVNTLIETIENLLKSYPNEQRLILWKSKAYLLAENTKEAMKSAELILKKNPSNREALQVKALIFENEKNYKMLASTYNQQFKLEPWNINLAYKISDNLNKAELFKESVNWSRQYIQYDTTNANAYYQLGFSLSNVKDYSNAINAFTKSLNLNSGLSESFFERGCCYYQLLNYEKAFSDLCMALDLKPYIGKYFYYRGLTNFALKRTIGACRDFERAKQYGYMDAESYIQRICNDK
jgi:tetratricopeptide (TPR) repeat protein